MRVFKNKIRYIKKFYRDRYNIVKQTSDSFCSACIKFYDDSICYIDLEYLHNSRTIRKFNDDKNTIFRRYINDDYCYHYLYNCNYYHEDEFGNICRK